VNKKIAVILGVSITLFGVGFYAFGMQKTTSRKEAKTTTVRKGNLKIAFSIDGKTTVERRDLKFTVSGKVSHIAVKEGQEVKKWQYLMALDTQDVQKNLEKNLKDYSIVRNTFDQTGQVTYPAGALNDTMKRALENSQYTLDKSVLDVEIKNIALKESYLYSPIDGVVSAINIKEGEATNTQNGGVVITITKPGSLAFESYAEDTDVLKINKDQKTLVKVDAIQNVTFPSQVEFISNLATVDQNGLSSYKIRASISDQKGYSLLDGMAGQIQFITKERLGVLIIPNGAVYRKDNMSYVTKLENNKGKETVIETGFTDGKEVEVSSGLNQGDTIIIP
jgi:RND family efflux transporter MFP subunit